MGDCFKDEAIMRRTRHIWIAMTLLASLGLASCETAEPAYSRETPKVLLTKRRQIWAVAPVMNLSGEKGVDPILQADLLFQQLQQVRGLTVIPVNRVVEVYASLRIDHVSSPDQAALVCDLLQCDGLLVSSCTIYDPYNPPKFGLAMQLFLKPGSYARPANVDPRELVRRAAPRESEGIAVVNADIVQAVGMFDAANGSVRDRIKMYAAGRHDPVGPLGEKEYFVHMDRFCGFVYSELIDQLIGSSKLKGL